MNLPLLKLVDAEAHDDDEKARRLFDIARAIADTLARFDRITRQALKRHMVQAFGASDADGAWTMRDAYDALEAAQVILLGRLDFPLSCDADRQAIFAALRRFEEGLPTQSYRTERQVGLQQFSTPIALAWLAAHAARLQTGDHVLEPSAGTGMLAAHAARAGARLTLNERDPRRAALLRLAAGQDVATHDAEFIDDMLGPDIRPSVVLINPPFSRSEGRGRDRHAGARHLRSALLRLAEGGRCVAIMAPNFAADGSAATGYAAVAEVVQPRVEITILGNPYAKHGTSIAVRLLVYDKGWAGETVRRHVADIGAALPLVLALPPRLDPSRPLPPASAAAPVGARPLLKPSPSALFAALSGPKCQSAREVDPGSASNLDPFCIGSAG